jgi:dihydroflavonol-4-reductase
MRDIVVSGTGTVLAAACAAGGLRTVYVSSLVAVDGTKTPHILNEDSPWTLGGQGLTYAVAKHDAEAACLRAAGDGLPVVIVNPAEVYGPHDRKFVTAGNLLDFARSNPVPVCNGGTSIAHVDDVAAGIVAALLRGRSGERYILGGENVTIRQLASLTMEILGLKRRIITVPNSVVRAIGAICKTLHIPLPFNSNVIAYATRYWCVDASKARNELGVSFRSARETISSVLEWLHAEGHLPACQPHFVASPSGSYASATQQELAASGMRNSDESAHDLDPALAEADHLDEAPLLVDSHAA